MCVSVTQPTFCLVVKISIGRLPSTVVVATRVPSGAGDNDDTRPGQNESRTPLQCLLMIIRFWAYFHCYMRGSSLRGGKVCWTRWMTSRSACWWRLCSCSMGCVQLSQMKIMMNFCENLLGQSWHLKSQTCVYGEKESLKIGSGTSYHWRHFSTPQFSKVISRVWWVSSYELKRGEKKTPKNFFARH